MKLGLLILAASLASLLVGCGGEAKKEEYITPTNTSKPGTESGPGAVAKTEELVANPNGTEANKAGTK